MILSAIVPTLNEKSHISTLITDFIANSPLPCEIFILDAGSTDGTIDIVNKLTEDYPNVILIKNEKKTVSHAFNVAYERTKGSYICLLGAHASYDKNYFKVCCEYLSKDEADVVGGFLTQRGKSAFGNALSFVMSNKFGVGNTEFRTIREKSFVDSVAFAIYKRELFDVVGLLDENIVRNQDDELHYRINSYGFRILMIPEVTATYFVRDSPIGLWKQYYEYGYYKPYVLRKVKKSIRIRHIVPSFFVGYLFFVLIFIISKNIILYFLIMPLILYLLIVICLSLSKFSNVKDFFYRIIAFFIIHCSYGLGFINGLFFRVGSNKH